jgi:hypothetical protein
MRSTRVERRDNWGVKGKVEEMMDDVPVRTLQVRLYR